jgi:uncharacterized protein YjbJ (UPF0337 family)
MRFAVTAEKETAMNWDTIAGNWKQMKGAAKTKWGELTGDELDQVDGNRERLVGLVQERYGYAKEQAQSEVDDWMANQR